jgi:hypothetical protein
VASPLNETFLIFFKKMSISIIYHFLAYLLRINVNLHNKTISIGKIVGLCPLSTPSQIPTTQHLKQGREVVTTRHTHTKKNKKNRTFWRTILRVPCPLRPDLLLEGLNQTGSFLPFRSKEKAAWDRPNSVNFPSVYSTIEPRLL